MTKYNVARNALIQAGWVEYEWYGNGTAIFIKNVDGVVQYKTLAKSGRVRAGQHPPK